MMSPMRPIARALLCCAVAVLALPDAALAAPTTVQLTVPGDGAALRGWAQMKAQAPSAPAPPGDVPARAFGRGHVYPDQDRRDAR